MRWWTDWKLFGCFPWPGNDLNTQPAFVYDVLTVCEVTHAAALKEASERSG